MEQNELYKSVERRIKSLENQLSLCDQTTYQCEQSGREAEEDIEEHFAKCINALAERKAVLLKEASQRVTSLKEMVADTRGKLAASIESCKQTLKVSSITYAVSPSGTELIWKDLLSIPAPEVCSVRVNTRLSMTLFNDIQKHGEVGDTSRYSKAEMVTTLAGSLKGQKDGKGLNASFNLPYGMCINPHDECLYICDHNNSSIRKLTMQGDVTTFVEVKTPFGIVVGHISNCFYATTNNNHSITKISLSGAVSTFAGSGQPGSSDGVGSNASFNYPRGVAIDQRTGNLFIADSYNHLIRMINPQGVVSTLAGSQSGFADGSGKAANFKGLLGICFDERSQSLLVCDNPNNKLRRVKLNGEVSTICEIQQPSFVAVTANQTILVSTYHNTLLKVTQQGSENEYKVEAVAGSGVAGRVDGIPDNCCFNNPQEIAVHEVSHSCFVADCYNHAIRKLSFQP